MPRSRRFLVALEILLTSTLAARAHAVEPARAPFGPVANPVSQEDALAAPALEWTGHAGWSLVASTDAAVARDDGNGTGVPTTHAEGDAVVSGELRVDGDGCRLLALGAVARAHLGGDGGASGAQWIDACIYHEASRTSFFLGNRVELGARPALSAPRLTWRRSYTENTSYLAFPGAMVSPHAGFLATRIETGWIHQSDGDAARDQLRYDIDMDVFLLRWPDAGVSLDIFGLHPRLLGGALQDGIFQIDAGSLTVGAHGLRGEASAGWAFGSLAPEPPPGRPPSATGPRFQADTPVGKVSVESTDDHARAGAGASAERRAYLTFDDELAREDRLTGWVSARRRRVDLKVTGFGVQTTVWTLAGASSTERTGGVVADVGVDLGHGVRAGATAEAARSFYASLDGDATPHPGRALRLFATVSARFGAAR